MPHPNLFGVDWPTSITIALALLAVLLAALGIFLIVASGIAYVNFRAAATRRAEETARQVASEVAETVATRAAKLAAVTVAKDTTDKYLTTNLSSIVEEYIRLMPLQRGASNAEADAIAQEEGGDIPNENDQTDQGNPGNR